MYIDGKGVEKNYEEAVKYFKLSADQGNTEGQYLLGRCYLNGNGIENKYDNRIFPTFADVLKEIRNVMNNSKYSDENKGNYSGALQTRLKSLTNGINGQIFSNDSISDEELFEKNTIIDLSRVGSTETKALIMGLLILKLQEHRMANPEINSELKHITVIEEAHNLLKRTSTEQVSESSNLVPNGESYNNEQINRLLPLIVYELKNRDPFYNKLFCRFTEVYKERGSIL